MYIKIHYKEGKRGKNKQTIQNMWDWPHELFSFKFVLQFTTHSAHSVTQLKMIFPRKIHIFLLNHNDRTKKKLEENYHHKKKANNNCLLVFNRGESANTKQLEKENMHNKKGLKNDIFWTFGKKLIEFKKISISHIRVHEMKWTQKWSSHTNCFTIVSLSCIPSEFTAIKD